MTGVRLKWPNDLVTAHGKLGGILIEMRAEAGGPVHVVVGIGLNVLLDDAARAAVDATGNIADDIRAHRHAGAGSQCDRRRAAGAAGAGARGISAQRADAAPRELEPCDALRDHEVRVENAGEITRGVARGIDAHGALAGRDTQRACGASFPAKSRCASNMSTTLLVDIGNTRVKWAMLRDASAGPHARGARMRTRAALRALVRAAPRDVNRVIVVSVVDEASSARARQPRRARVSASRPEYIRSTQRARGVPTAIAIPGAWAQTAGCRRSAHMRSRRDARSWSPTSAPRSPSTP